ncbi:MAG: DNA repair protein RecN [Vicinamibacteria bacterium]|nr:DNA repair protein RecN [Vicinamibacteria bacterium]
MLRYLSIQHLAVIERLEIEFDAGFTVLTGETGAGKSILVEAVGLLLGARASSDLVRTGEQLATIQAIFDTGREEVIVRRELTAQGRSHAFVNGALATSGALRDLASRLLEIHGQHEHQGLLAADSHLDLLDGFADLQQARDEVAALHQRVTALRAERDTLRLDERQTLARLDLLTFQRDEIEKAGLRAGEDDALEAERLVLANAEKLQRLSAEAYELLYERDEAVLSALNAVWKRVADLASVDVRAQPYLESRALVASQLEDLAFFLRDYAGHIDTSPRRLQDVDDRLGLLDRLKRKYGPGLADVIAHAQTCRHDLLALQSSDERAGEVATLLHAAEGEYRRHAERLSEARRAAAGRFARELVSALGDLAMGRTRFEVRVEALAPDAWGSRGLDQVEFFVSPNPGEDLRPLTRIVSGGELSRLMLAIKTLTSRAGKGATLIFDEVDAGIGGHTADVVGRRLQALAADAQVLCITHLPQIAAAADQHYRIAKSVRGQRTVTSVERLDAEGRRQELARMIAGQTVTDRVLASAGDLLAERQRAKGESKPKGESESRKAKGRR